MLRDRGMEVSDDVARQWLSVVSYYRLSGYWYLTRVADPTNPDKRLDSFSPGTTFSDVVQLYEADLKLRTLIHDGIERIEIACRTQLIGVLRGNEALAYLKPSSMYRDNFDLESWWKTASKRVSRARKHHKAVEHYSKNYKEQFPLWVLAEVLDFSDTSKLFQGLSFQKQRRIAENLGLRIDMNRLSKTQRKKLHKKHPLANWLEQLSVLRNYCAHHSRVWNSSYVPVPTNALKTIPGLESLPTGQSEKIYGALVIMTKLLETISPRSSWKRGVRALLEENFLTNKLVDSEDLGIPERWADEPIWQTG
ncbi:Abi family protein [Micrococcoides hystricis]|uniref:Abi family protein n=1 Tax=Micrococcoides hystricis TaxID=1572761 RepID=A0ABV6PCT7_9MICC